MPFGRSKQFGTRGMRSATGIYISEDLYFEKGDLQIIPKDTALVPKTKTLVPKDKALVPKHKSLVPKDKLFFQNVTTGRLIGWVQN